MNRDREQPNDVVTYDGVKGYSEKLEALWVSSKLLPSDKVFAMNILIVQALSAMHKDKNTVRAELDRLHNAQVCYLLNNIVED